MTHDVKGAPVASTNSFDARGTLEVGEQSYEIYRLARRRGARDAALQPEGAAGEPAAHRGRREHHRRPHPGARRVGPERRARHRDPVHAGPRDHAGLHRRAVRRRPRHHARGRRRPRRRPDEDQPARAGRAGHRPLGDHRRLRPRRRLRAQRRHRVRAQPASATSSCAGARPRSTSSRSSRRAPASCTRSTSSTSPASSWCATAVAYPDTCVGTDSHTTMVNGLGVLGWGVGGIEAEAAMLGQPVSHADPARRRLQAHRRDPGGRHRHRPRAHDHRACCASTAWSASSSSSTATGVAAVPLANRATIGNMSPEFGSTCAIFPIDEVTLDYLRLTGRSAEQVALVEAYAKEQGLWHDPARRAGLLRVPRARPVAPSCPSIAGPKRPQDRIALTDAKERVPQGAAHLRRRTTRATPGRRRASRPATPRRRAAPTAPTAASRPPTSRRRHRPSHRARCRSRPPRARRSRSTTASSSIASITSCTNTSNPSVMMAAALLAKNAVEKGLTVAAVGQDLAGAGLEGRHRLLREGRPLAVPREARLPPGRLRLHHLHRQLRPAARGDLRGRQRERPRRGVGAVGQPQLRGPDQPRRQDELPRLAAAGHRLRARRHDGLRLRHRAAGHRHRRRAGLPARHLAVARSTSRRSSHRRSARTCSPPTTPTCSPATSAGSRCRPPTGNTFDWDADSTYVRKPPYFDGMQPRARAGHRHHRRPRAGQARRLGHDRPHQPGRLDQGRQPRRQVPRRARRRAQGLQLLRLPSRQPRGDDPRHVRQHPPAQPAPRRRRGRLHPQLPGPVARADDDLRRLGGLPGGRHPAGHPRRARSTAPGRRATGRPRAPRCSACAPSSPSPTSASTART